MSVSSQSRFPLALLIAVAILLFWLWGKVTKTKSPENKTIVTKQTEKTPKPKPIHNKQLQEEEDTAVVLSDIPVRKTTPVTNEHNRYHVLYNVPECVSGLTAGGIPNGWECRTADWSEEVLQICRQNIQYPDVLFVKTRMILQEAAQLLQTTVRENTNVILFSETEWKLYLQYRKLPLSLGGFFDGDVYINASLENFHEVLRHELFHAQLFDKHQCAPRSINEGMASWFGGHLPYQSWIRVGRGLEMIPTDQIDAAFVNPNLKIRLQAYGEAQLRIAEAFDIDGEQALERLLQNLSDEQSDAETMWEVLDEEVTNEDLSAAAKWIIWGDEDMSTHRFRLKMEDQITCRVPYFKTLQQYFQIGPETELPGVFNMEDGGRCKPL